MKNKYHRMYINGRKIDEHRLLMELKIGRKLERSEHVHHINGNIEDNRIENLMLIPQADHQKLHKQKYPLIKTCEVCKNQFTPKPTKRKRSHVCSAECKIVLDKINAQKRCRPIVQTNLDGSPVKVWDSATSASKSLGYFGSNICKCCNGVIGTYKGYRWEYVPVLEHIFKQMMDGAL